MKFKALIALLGCFAVLAQPILLVADSPTWKKCLYTEHSPDKTLEARIGFLRRERGRCSARFEIKIIDMEGKVKEEIYSKQHRCEETKTNDPYVVKHTSEQSDYQGLYEVCAEMIFNENQNTIVEIFMGERLNPIIFEHSESQLPLIESRDLIDLDLTAQSIKRSLIKSRGYYRSNREKGELLDSKITEMMELNQISNILQIIALIAFGVVWVKIASRLKRTK